MEEMRLTNSYTLIDKQHFLLPVLFLHSRTQSQMPSAASINRNRLTIFPIIQEIEAIVASGNDCMQYQKIMLL